MTKDTESVIIHYDPTTDVVSVSQDRVEIRKNGTPTFLSPDADALVLCCDNTARPADQSRGWFVKDVNHGKSDKNDIVFFVPRGGSRDVAVKDLNAIVAPPGATEPNYTYPVIVLTPDSNGTRNKVLHPLDPTVIIRDS